MNKFADMIKRHEGYDEHLYRCTSKKLTIGYGWNIEDRGLPPHICEALLDYAVAENDKFLMKFEWFRELSNVRKDVIRDMCFMGIGSLLKFTGMIKALEKKDYLKAAAEMLDSKWAYQVKGRSTELAKMMIEDRYLSPAELLKG